MPAAFRKVYSAAATITAAFQLAAFDIASQCECSIDSTLRTNSHNEKRKGALTSYHMTGLAADLVPDDPRKLAKARALATANGLEIIDKGTHWHLQPAT